LALQPGKKRIERILLNFEHNISAPTDYEVDAVRHLDHAGTDLDYFKAGALRQLSWRVVDACRVSAMAVIG
jgi:hypothetical protein